MSEPLLQPIEDQPNYVEFLTHQSIIPILEELCDMADSTQHSTYLQLKVALQKWIGILNTEFQD